MGKIIVSRLRINELCLPLNCFKTQTQEFLVQRTVSLLCMLVFLLIVCSCKWEWLQGEKTTENEQQLQKDSKKRYLVRCGCTIPRASAALLWHSSPQTERTILIRNSLWSYFNCFSRPRATISISGCKRPSIIRDYQTICLRQTIARTKYQSLKNQIKNNQKITKKASTRSSLLSYIKDCPWNII